MQTENDGTAIFKLLACKDEMLLVARDPGVDVEGQGLASDDDLHQSNALQLVRKSKKNKQKWTYLASVCSSLPCGSIGVVVVPVGSQIGNEP